jgi:small-conductance mechanosensitive channel/CRP-like cAMP-binding protein
MSVGSVWRPPFALAVPFVVVATLIEFEGLFAQPIAFLTGLDLAAVKQAEAGLFLAIGVLLVARFVRRDLVHGILQDRAGKALPHLLGDVAAALVLLLGVTLILTLVYGRDVTAIVATGGLGLAVLGIALRDVILAVFNGAALNVENAFSVGDRVKIGEVDGKVVQTTWRATTVLTRARRLVSIPNVALGTASITNFDRPDKSEQRILEICLDYDVTVESAERILLAGALGATGFTHVIAPRVHAIRLERDGVLYAIRYVVPDNGDALAADHAVIRSVLERLRDTGIGVAYPKKEVVSVERRIRVADRTLDRYVLVQQCAMFRGLDPDARRAIADSLKELKLEAGAVLVEAGETRSSLFIVGEGLLQRTRARADRIELVQERFVTTQFLGRRALLAELPHPGTISAVTESLVFELTRADFAAFLGAHPAARDAIAAALAQIPSQAIGASPQRATHSAQPVQSRDFYRNQLQSVSSGPGE